MLNQLSCPRLETISETAELTGLAKYHVRQLVKQNKVKYITTGKKYLINYDSLVEYLNNGDNAAEKEVTMLNNQIKKVEV